MHWQNQQEHCSEVFETKLQSLWKNHSSVGRKYSWAPPKAIILHNQRSKQFNSAVYLPYSNQNGRLSNGSDMPAMTKVFTLEYGQQ